jgi:hypothetical protein
VFDSAGIPVVDVYVCAADCGLMYLDQHFTGAGLRHGNLAQFQTGACHGFDNGVHILFHNVPPNLLEK